MVVKKIKPNLDIRFISPSANGNIQEKDVLVKIDDEEVNHWEIERSNSYLKLFIRSYHEQTSHVIDIFAFPLQLSSFSGVSMSVLRSGFGSSAASTSRTRRRPLLRLTASVPTPNPPERS